jgi:putative transposase
MVRHFARHDYKVSRVKMRRLMRKLGLQAVYQAPKTSNPHPNHKIYPYLLREKTIKHSNQVWCSDITYIPLQHGFLYLVAIMDWHPGMASGFIHRAINSGVDSRFCVEALQEAIDMYGAPEIFNTDQGSQFTSFEFTNTLKESGIKVSMDGRGRWMDNVFIERLW